jgi:sulfur carrier protein
MRILVNAVEYDVPESCTVRELLEQEGLDRSPCAVEVNRELVPKREHDVHRLAEGDHVEIVTLVGGG